MEPAIMYHRIWISGEGFLLPGAKYIPRFGDHDLENGES
jgi:hypothetical protein